jgi:hypothetical protein
MLILILRLIPLTLRGLIELLRGLLTIRSLWRLLTIRRLSWGSTIILLWWWLTPSLLLRWRLIKSALLMIIVVIEPGHDMIKVAKL